jgi:dienelactone hydrolase
MRMQRPILNSFLASGLALVVQGSAAQSVIPPLPTTGPYPVACTNVEQDLSRVSQGETASQYWRGVASGDTVRYVNALLVSPGNSLVSTFTAPRDGELYDRWAGQPVSYVYLACYPTTAANARADYTLPGDVVVPRMQRGAEAPILPSSPSRLPVLLYSHGYGGSPLDGNYLSALVAFASWGYVTLAPFHGDLRYSVFGPDAWSLRFSIPVWDEFVAMQAIRPLSASAGLDVLLARAEWRDRVDTGRIGAFGISQGGETIALLAGAELTYGLFRFDSKRVTLDSRVRAGVGYIPYFGLDNLPAFGRDQEGVREFTMPFLALSGTDDSIAPQAMVRQAIDRMEGPRGHVLFSGQGHNLDPSSGADILTWALGFLDAWLNGNAAAKSKLTQVVSVEGGLDDRKEVYVDPTGGGGGGVGEVVDTIEYYNTSLDHYFITAFPDEAADLDAGGQVQGWTRTGFRFPTWKVGTGPGNDACRFFGTEGRGPNSHFYTISAAECEKVRSNPDWTFEALAFRGVEPLSAGCAADYRTVTRLYNNGMGGQANHRYLTDAQEIDRMVARGWLVEGPVFCVPR